MYSSRSASSDFVTSCRYWLAANAVWAVLVVSASATVTMRLPLAKGWPVIAFFSLISAVFAFRKLWKSKIRAKTLLIWALGFVTSGYLLWPSFTKGGCFVSVTGDTWLYCAFGQYLVDYARGIEGGLSFIDQYGAGWSESRFGTPSVLGFLSILFHSSTAGVLRLFTLFVLVNIFSGFVILSRRFYCNRLLSLAAGLFAVICGWVPNALNIGGLDNLLFLSLFPFLVVRLDLYRFGSKSWSTSFGLAILGSSIFYVYPEGLAIAGVLFLPLFCEYAWSGTCRRQRAWYHYVFSVCLGLVIISPYFLGFFVYLRGHIAIGIANAAGVGIFPGLLSSRFLPAIFAFGQEYSGTRYSPRDLVLPFSVVALILFGVLAYGRRRKSLILAWLILIIMVFWQGLSQKYDYGLYKVLFIGSLIWIPCLFKGATTLVNWVPRSKRPFAATLGTIVFFGAAVAERKQQYAHIPYRQAIPMKWYSQLTDLSKKVGQSPVLLLCDNTFDQEWAVFFLKHVSLKVPEFFGYLGAAEPLLNRAKVTNEPAAFALLNKSVEDAVWTNRRFSLLDLTNGAKLIGVQTPDGLQHANGKPLVWLGNSATRFLIVSRNAQMAIFSAEECLIGPSRPEDKKRQMRFSIGGKVWRTEVSGVLSLEVTLKPGLNFLDVACEDSPTLPMRPSGDTRNLLVGLLDYRIRNKDEVEVGNKGD